MSPRLGKQEFRRRPMAATPRALVGVSWNTPDNPGTGAGAEQKRGQSSVVPMQQVWTGVPLKWGGGARSGCRSAPYQLLSIVPKCTPTVLEPPALSNRFSNRQ